VEVADFWVLPDNWREAAERREDGGQACVFGAVRCSPMAQEMSVFHPFRLRKSDRSTLDVSVQEGRALIEESLNAHQYKRETNLASVLSVSSNRRDLSPFFGYRKSVEKRKIAYQRWNLPKKLFLMYDMVPIRNILSSHENI
jgi:hypothetical protein